MTGAHDPVLDNVGEDDDSQEVSVDAPPESMEPVTNDHLQEPETLEYELNQITYSLEENLHEIPLPGPDQPQLLAKKLTEMMEVSQQKGCAPAAVPQPVATPCRNDASHAKSSSRAEPLHRLKAHEDQIDKTYVFSAPQCHP